MQQATLSQERLRATATGCLEWTGPRIPDGYGHVHVGGKMTLTHRLAWEHVHGPIPAGRLVLHRCDNPPCCNVDHLFLGNQSDNMLDMWRKRRRIPLVGEAHWKSKLNEGDVIAIRSILRSNRVTDAEVGRAFGISKNHVGRIKRREFWRHV